MAKHPLWLLAGFAVAVWAAAMGGATPTVQAQGQIIWFADHEEPGEKAWYSPGGLAFGGGEFDSGCASTPPLAGWAGTKSVRWDSDSPMSVPEPPPGGGNFGLQMTMAAPCGNGLSSATRLFRWQEPIQHPDLYYKVWYYFPQNYSLIGDPAWVFWSIFGWKSKTQSPPQNDPFYDINVYNRAGTGNMYTGNMYLGLYNWQCGALSRFCGEGGALPPRVSGTEAIDVPVNQWFYIEALYKSRGDLTGEIKIWQGDSANRWLLWDITNVQTKYSGGWTEWYVSNYSSGLDPQPAYFFIDNAEIRTP